MKRTERAKIAEQFKVGDVVTWGRGVCSHIVTEVTPIGVFVDVTFHKDSIYYATKRTDDDRILLFVSFDKNNRCKSGRGPISISNLEPDKESCGKSQYSTESLVVDTRTR